LLQAGQSGHHIWLGAIFSVPIQASPWAHPASMTMGTGSLSWGKVAGHGIDCLTPYITEVKERV